MGSLPFQRSGRNQPEKKKKRIEQKVEADHRSVRGRGSEREGVGERRERSAAGGGNRLPQRKGREGRSKAM